VQFSANSSAWPSLVHLAFPSILLPEEVGNCRCR
jgi:hypothetical protein